MKPKAIVGLEEDGWGVIIGDKEYRWNHNDDDLGTDSLVKLLKDLGFDVTLEAWY